MKRPGTEIKIRLQERPIEVESWVRRALGTQPPAGSDAKEKVVLQVPKQPFVHILHQKNNKPRI